MKIFQAGKVSYVQFLQNICEFHGVFRIWIEFILADFFFKKGVHTHRVAFCIFFSGVSRPSEKGRGGWSKKKLFPALRASVWSKNKGGGRPHGPLPWIYHCSCYSLESVNLQLHVHIRVWDPLLFSNALYWQNSLHELSQCAQVLCDIVHQHQHMRLQADGMKFSSSNTD